MIQQLTPQVSRILTGLLICSALACAQSPSEISAFSGTLVLGGGGGAHPIVGVTAGTGVTDHVRLFAEFSGSGLGSATISGQGFDVVNITDRLWLFGGGASYTFGSSKKLVPYITGALDFSHEAAAAKSGGVTLASLNSDSACLSAGAGLRIFIGDSYGLKPEFRFERYQGSGGGECRSLHDRHLQAVWRQVRQGLGTRVETPEPHPGDA